MDNIRLTKDEMLILSALANNTYPSTVPESDVSDFLRLEKYGLVSHVRLDQSSVKVLYGATLTREGKEYLAIKPEKKRIHIDWKWWVGIIVAILGVVATIVF
jgi:hypothetical protein